MKRCFILLLTATTMLFACTPENEETPTNDNAGGWNTSFPEKKVQQVLVDLPVDGGVQCTINFTWNGDQLERISFVNPYGVSINNMYFYYDDKGHIAKTAQQMHEDDEIHDAYVYSYDSHGRLEKQVMQRPYRINHWNQDENGNSYYTEDTVYRPLTYTFSYSNGHVSKIHRKKVYWTFEDDGDQNTGGGTYVEKTEESNYVCSWTGDNMTCFSLDGTPVYLHYDANPSPFNFPMGIEVFNPLFGLGDTEDLVEGDYSYMNTFYWLTSVGKNNVTSVNLGYDLFAYTYTYDSDGYPHSLTLVAQGIGTFNYTFVY